MTPLRKGHAHIMIDDSSLVADVSCLLKLRENAFNNRRQKGENDPIKRFYKHFSKQISFFDFQLVYLRNLYSY